MAPKKKANFSIYWMYIAIGVILTFLYFSNDNSNLTKELSWTEFQQKVEAGDVEKITVFINDNKAEATLTKAAAKKIFKELPAGQTLEGRQAIIASGIPSSDVMEQAVEKWRADGHFKGQIEYKRSENSWANTLWAFGPVVLIIAFWIFMMRGMGRGAGGGIFSVGKSKAKLFDKENSSKVTFKDVAGLSEAKQEVEEIVDFLRNPQTYTQLGGRIPKGALLVGPPGTGKTLLAKAVAGEAEVPFFSISGSDFVEMFVGVGASRVRDLFKQAKEKSPCIVFIDEIDAVGRARSMSSRVGGNDERESTLNQLLTEMDGFGANSGIIILAATNRADILDKALLRAGRFDRQIYVELPELSDRVEIFKVHLRNIKLAPDVDIDLLARQTPGFSGADIANVCNEAALIAARHKKQLVEKQDFMDAVDRIIGGLEKKSKITTEEERRAIATHEAGHATISWHLKYASPLVKVTIVPRGKALGAAWYLPEERQIQPEQALLDEICSLLGGRAAEELFLGSISTGAANDLERVTKTAYAMVAYYGMGSAATNLSYYDSTGQEYGLTKPYSEERAKEIDDEVSRIVKEQYDRAKQILTQYADGHHRLTDVLLAREVIFTEDVEQIFGKRQWASRNDEIMALNEKNKAAEQADSDNPAGSDNPAEHGSDADAATVTTSSDGSTTIALPPDLPPNLPPNLPQ